MEVHPDKGSYSRYVIHERLSFRYNSTGPVLDRIRDGKTGLVKTVTRDSAGLYTIKIRADRPYVAGGKYITVHASLSQVAAPTVYADVHYVEGTWATGNDADGSKYITFKVKVFKRATDVAAAVASDPDNGDRISVTLSGSYSTVGQDAL
jgi:hypothetical protein